MSPAPKINVIIPTRERCDVLEKSLRTVTAQNYDNLEILVSDNFSSDDTADVVKRANDSRIRYVNTGSRLSMSHNWEFALSHVKEGWVTFIGDDDGLLPSSLNRVAEIIRETDVDAVRSSCSTYAWPHVSAQENGELIVPMGSGTEMRDSLQWQGKVLRGVEKYTQLPMIYNGGFIRLSVLDRIKEKTGTYFGSCIPDVYSAMAISSVIDRYVYSHEPLAISGTSRHSTGHSVYSVSDSRNPSSGLKFYSEGNIAFHADLPLFADGSQPVSLQALVYESYLQSSRLRAMASNTGHARQLAIILAMSGAHRKSIEEWGGMFAQMHGLNYEAVKRAAYLKRAFLPKLAAAKKLGNAANSVISDRLPIKDIFEASIASAVIRSSKGRRDTLHYLATRLIRHTS